MLTVVDFSNVKVVNMDYRFSMSMWKSMVHIYNFYRMSVGVILRIYWSALGNWNLQVDDAEEHRKCCNLSGFSRRHNYRLWVNDFHLYGNRSRRLYNRELERVPSGAWYSELFPAGLRTWPVLWKLRFKDPFSSTHRRFDSKIFQHVLVCSSRT